jgi:hypothetical protein
MNYILLLPNAREDRTNRLQAVCSEYGFSQTYCYYQEMADEIAVNPYPRYFPGFSGFKTRENHAVRDKNQK